MSLLRARLRASFVGMDGAVAAAVDGLFARPHRCRAVLGDCRPRPYTHFPSARQTLFLCRVHVRRMYIVRYYTAAAGRIHVLFHVVPYKRQHACVRLHERSTARCLLLVLPLCGGVARVRVLLCQTPSTACCERG